MAHDPSSRQLPSRAVSTFCENMAMLLAAGVGPAEGVALLCETGVDSDFHAATAVHTHLDEQGGTLSDAMTASGWFEEYACRLLAVGESCGRAEESLRSLAVHYAQSDRTRRSLHSAVVYPVILLLMMAAILVVLLAFVLPVFASVYSSFVGEVASSSFRYLQVAYWVGGVSLAVAAVLGLALLAAAVASTRPAGRAVLGRLAQGAPVVGEISRQLALSQFMQVLSSFMASGMDQDAALTAAAGLVQDSRVRRSVLACQQQMAEGATLSTAVMQQKLLEPLYARMLATGAHSGQLAQVTQRLAGLLEQDGRERLEAAINAVEPLLSALLTVAVGVTLVAAMLPLIGILGTVA